MGMEDLNDMVWFAEVVERGGFAAAGRALGIPKQRLSRRVAELEARLGVRLLHRTTRKLSITDIGERYLRHCVALREQALAASEVVAEARGEPSGLIRATCPVTVMQTLVGPALPAFLIRYPKVRLSIETTNRVVDVVEEGIDIALRVRPTIGDLGSLVVRTLATTRSMLVACPDLLHAHGCPAVPEELTRLPTIAMDGADGEVRWPLFGPGGREYLFGHQPRCVVNDLLTLKLGALAGLGLTVLPDYLCAAERAAGTLVEVLPGWQPPPGVFHAVFASRRGMLPAVRAFLDLLVGLNEPGQAGRAVRHLPSDDGLALY